MKQQSALFTAIKKKHEFARKHFKEKHTRAKKWLEERGYKIEDIRRRSANLLTGATVSGALLLASPQLPLIGNPASQVQSLFNSVSELLNYLKQHKQEKLNHEDEYTITESIKKYYGIRSAFELDHNRLPTNFGSMGLEQHLERFSGDTLFQHLEFQEAGMAPYRGAFGYFAAEGKSHEQMVQEEKYYVVLQTFLIPEWNQDWMRLKDWYKFRKFIVINPQSGKAVIAVLGDSGPAIWTGKQFGGSPEVMHELGFYLGQTKGNVVVLFLDDPGNQVPLGPAALKDL